MPRRSARNIEPLVRAIVRAALRGIRGELPSAQQMQRIEVRLRKLERKVRPQGLRPSRRGLATKRPRGRPRSNPETCTARGCQAPARARTLCSAHYQCARWARLARKK